jgi:hypothetical protein
MHPPPPTRDTTPAATPPPPPDQAPAYINAALSMIPSNETALEPVPKRASGKPTKKVCAFRGLELTAAAAALSAVASGDVANTVSGALTEYLNAGTRVEKEVVVNNAAREITKEYGQANKLSRKSDHKSVSPKAAVTDLSAAGVKCVSCAVGAVGVAGLWGLLGLFGIIGLLPAGVIGTGMLGMLPPGIIFIVPGLVLVPLGTSLSDDLVGLVFPNGGTKFDFPGTCKIGVPPPRRDLSGLLPDYVVDMMPPKICLPPGNLWYVGALPAVVNAPEYNWPNRTVIIPPKTIILPPGDFNASADSAGVGSDDAVWYPANTPVTPEPSEVGVVEPAADGGGTVVVPPTGAGSAAAAASPDGFAPAGSSDAYGFDDDEHMGVVDKIHQLILNNPLVKLLAPIISPLTSHGGSPLLPPGPPPGSCPGTTLGPIAPLGVPPGDAFATIRQLFGSLHGIGHLGSCAVRGWLLLLL